MTNQPPRRSVLLIVALCLLLGACSSAAPATVDPTTVPVVSMPTVLSLTPALQPSLTPRLPTAAPSATAVPATPTPEPFVAKALRVEDVFADVTVVPYAIGTERTDVRIEVNGVEVKTDFEQPRIQSDGEEPVVIWDAAVQGKSNIQENRGSKKGTIDGTEVQRLQLTLTVPTNIPIELDRIHGDIYIANMPSHVKVTISGDHKLVVDTVANIEVHGRDDSTTELVGGSGAVGVFVEDKANADVKEMRAETASLGAADAAVITATGKVKILEIHTSFSASATFTGEAGHAILSAIDSSSVKAGRILGEPIVTIQSPSTVEYRR